MVLSHPLATVITSVLITVTLVRATSTESTLVLQAIAPALDHWTITAITLHALVIFI